MASNLDIAVTVDTGNATANIRILQAQIRELSKEITAASKEALKTGDFSTVRAYGQEIDRLTRSLRQEKQAQQEVTLATRQGSIAQAESTAIAREATQHVASFGRALGITGLSARSLRIGMAGLFGAELINLIRETITNLNELQSAAKAVGGAGGGDPAFLKGLRSDFRGSGEDAKFADQLITQFNKTLDETRLKRGQTGTVDILGGKQTTSDIDVLSGKADKASGSLRELQTVLRGGRPAPRADTALAADPLGALDVNTSKRREANDVLREEAQRIIALTDATERNAATQKVWGLNFSQIEEQLRKFAAGDFPKLPVPDTAPLKEYNKSLEELNKTWHEIVEGITTAALPAATSFTEKINSELKKDIQLVKDIKAALFGATPSAPPIEAPKKADVSPAAAKPMPPTGPGGMETDAEYFARTGFHYGPRAGERASLQPTPRAGEIPIGGFDPSRPSAAIPPVPARKPEADIAAESKKASDQAAADAEAAASKTETAWSQSTSQISRDLTALGDVFSALWDGVISEAQNAANTIAQAANSAVQAASKASTAVSKLATSGQDFSSGFASGGYVRGPGTARSDSILARLSNGEFVINAGAVRALGVGFLQGLNNFAAGGLVMPPLRFAEGGLVAASASNGRPVHLHLGGQSYALSGSAGVVGALVSHAAAEQMRSAGVKPSWFAGRPGGR